MRDVFLFAGQSNMSAYSQTGILRGSGLVTNPGSPGTAPNYVPGYQQTAANEWTGAPPASTDSAFKYPYPTLSTYPCLYNENTAGLASRVWDGWGNFVKQYPSYLDGSLGVGGSYGLELSFLYRHLQTYPSTPVAAIKQALGGTSLRGDWLPYTVQLGAAQAGSPTTLVMQAGNFTNPTGLYVKILSGTGAGSIGLCTGYNSGTLTATFSGGWSGAAPASGSAYGVERLQAQILRLMAGQAAARLDASDPGGWRWAGFIWMQGESGAHSAGTASSDAQYLSDARALFAWVRSLTGRADLPAVVGRIGDNWGWEGSGTTNANPYLIAAGYPYAALEASFQSNNGVNPVDGRNSTIPTLTRDGYLAGAVARRATQVTLGSDANCAWWNNDGHPTRPPYSLTAALTDLYAYHWGGPGNLAAGERAFTAYQSLLGPPPAASGKLKVRGLVLDVGGS